MHNHSRFSTYFVLCTYQLIPEISKFQKGYRVRLELQLRLGLVLISTDGRPIVQICEHVQILRIHVSIFAILVCKSCSKDILLLT